MTARDMDMDMGGGMGMDMSMASEFTPGDKHVAHILWYLVVAVVGLLVFRRVTDNIRILLFKRQRAHGRHDAIPFRPANALAQAYDTAIAILREASYPQPICFSGRLSRFVTPPPLGRCLALLAYWAAVLALLWSGAVVPRGGPDWGLRWEVVGFRAAWVSVAQLPLLYLLACKVSVLGLLTGLSYERLNWLHRWVARTMLATAAVHWAFFYREWDLAGFVALEMRYMPVVRYGFGAWAVLGWMVLSSAGLLRSRVYEVWVLQHVAGAGVLLWLVYVHVPPYARYNVYMAAGFVAFDRLARTALTLARNIHLLSKPRFLARTLGFPAEVTALSDGHLGIVIEDVDFTWRAGQHIYLSMPRVGPLENHPFTIANASRPLGKNGRQSLRLYIKVRSGFTRRLQKLCEEGAGPSRTLRAFIAGPWGNPPSTDRFESLVLLATGSGVSFTAPIFAQATQPGAVPGRVSFVWVVRDQSHVQSFQDKLAGSVKLARDRGIDICARIFITGTNGSVLAGAAASQTDSASTTGSEKEVQPRERVSSGIDSSSEDGQDVKELSTELEYIQGRPVLDDILRPIIEQAYGETGIIACGNAQFLAQLRNYTAWTSNDRAVHKGTGAQAIRLFTESYGW